jgi:hypothetical protein
MAQPKFSPIANRVCSFDGRKPLPLFYQALKDKTACFMKTSRWPKKPLEVQLIALSSTLVGNAFSLASAGMADPIFLLSLEKTMPLNIEITEAQLSLFLQGLRLLHIQKIAALAKAEKDIPSTKSFRTDDFGIDQINELIAFCESKQ